jgi:hypothetical protein
MGSFAPQTPAFQHTLGATPVRTLAPVISALLLAGALDPNCVPRHHAHPRAFAYHAHYYHAPPQPACRDPWPDPNLQDIKVADLPYSPVPAQSPDLGHLPSVIWPGYVPNPLAHVAHGGVGLRAAVSVPEPSTLGLFAFSIAVLFALRRCSGRRS